MFDTLAVVIGLIDAHPITFVAVAAALFGITPLLARKANRALRAASDSQIVALRAHLTHKWQFAEESGVQSDALAISLIGSLIGTTASFFAVSIICSIAFFSAPSSLGHPTSDGIAWLIAAAVLFPIITLLTNISTASVLTPTLVSALQSTAFVFLPLLAYVQLEERISPSLILAVALLLIGLTLLTKATRLSKNEHGIHTSKTMLPLASILFLLSLPISAAVGRAEAQVGIKLWLLSWPAPLLATLICYAFSFLSFWIAFSLVRIRGIATPSLATIFTRQWSVYYLANGFLFVAYQWLTYRALLTVGINDIAAPLALTIASSFVLNVLFQEEKYPEKWMRVYAIAGIIASAAGAYIAVSTR